MNLSVIVPTYNSEKTIDSCLKSIFDSTYKDFEVIVVNDGSTDSTLEKIKKYGCRVINLKKNQGVANARNIGAKHSKTNLLLFVDSDVLVHKDTISKMMEVYKLDSNIKIIGAVESGKYLLNNFGEKFLTLKRFYDFKWKKNEKRRKFSSLPECTFIEKKVFNKVGGYNTKYKLAGMEEYDIAYKLLKKGYYNYIYRDILHDHYKGSVKKRASTLLRRTSLYLPFFLKKKSLESEGANATMFDAFMSLFSFLGLITLPLAAVSIKLILIPFSFFIITIIANLKFFFYLIKKQGFFFSFMSIFPVTYIHLAIGFGLIFGAMKLFLNREESVNG